MLRFPFAAARWTTVGIVLATGVTLGQIQGMQSFDNRIEGTDVHTNALQDFTLIALHRSFQTFQPNSTLRVRFFLPQTAAVSDKAIFLEATELQDSFHYFMQAKPSAGWKEASWNVFEPWPTKDVIDRLGLRANNVGVRAEYRVKNGPPVFLPVDVYQSGSPPSTQTYTLHFITGSDLQALDVSVVDSAGKTMAAPRLQQKCNKTFNPSCQLYAAGSAHAVSLDMSPLPQGEYHVKLLGHIPGSLTPTSLDVLLYHTHQ